MRAAIGAGRERLVRQTLTESVVLAGAGGVLGVAPRRGRRCRCSRGWCRRRCRSPKRRASTLRMLGVAALVTLATGIGFGVLPALRIEPRVPTPTRCARARASGTSAGHRACARGAGHRGDRRVGRAARRVGLLVRALWRVQQIDPGFRAENVLTLRTALPGTKYGATARRQAFYDRVLGEIGAARRDERRIHQLSADGDARRHLAGDPRLEAADAKRSATAGRRIRRKRGWRASVSSRQDSSTPWASRSFAAATSATRTTSSRRGWRW